MTEARESRVHHTTPQPVRPQPAKGPVCVPTSCVVAATRERKRKEEEKEREGESWCWKELPGLEIGKGEGGAGRGGLVPPLGLDCNRTLMMMMMMMMMTIVMMVMKVVIEQIGYPTGRTSWMVLFTPTRWAWLLVRSIKDASHRSEAPVKRDEADEEEEERQTVKGKKGMEGEGAGLVSWSSEGREKDEW
eukprot:CAMPEP_0205914278 /NCGR_PEP_ID=MMETSP1325-20131115/7120_1 /ASSEMBLY_ACC=CAM_ASM_000708 /TAXON_ID=236786 /ORGANISM="Florenciella sp., Strain RCC1007" /LENGTH=189 /DNA_ID=CAMNT_0053281309 /DNA_START=770 /DNA_END=1339 /DNA_ORIENTATION=-